MDAQELVDLVNGSDDMGRTRASPRTVGACWVRYLARTVCARALRLMKLWGGILAILTMVVCVLIHQLAWIPHILLGQMRLAVHQP